MIGLPPILQNHVFDMVSSGQVFKLWIPAKNQFIAGKNERWSDTIRRTSGEPTAAGNL
jgi:hypothetical protein